MHVGKPCHTPLLESPWSTQTIQLTVRNTFSLALSLMLPSDLVIDRKRQQYLPMPLQADSFWWLLWLVGRSRVASIRCFFNRYTSSITVVKDSKCKPESKIRRLASICNIRKVDALLENRTQDVVIGVAVLDWLILMRLGSNLWIFFVSFLSLATIQVDPTREFCQGGNHFLVMNSKAYDISYIEIHGRGGVIQVQ